MEADARARKAEAAFESLDEGPDEVEKLFNLIDEVCVCVTLILNLNLILIIVRDERQGTSNIIVLCKLGGGVILSPRY